MSSKSIRKMVTTAILIALTVVFQLMRPMLGGSNPVSTYIIGSLVNLCTIVAACAVGLWSGIAVAVVTPLIAYWQGHAVIFMMPWIMAGNATLVLAFALFAKNAQGSDAASWVRFCVAGVIGMLVKYVVIVLGQSLMLCSTKGSAFNAALGVAAVAQVQQIITALIGMVLAKVILLALPASVKA
ncbi:MAG: ECF transporter S component [Clostridia bacterium]